MIAWAVKRTYKGATRITIYPNYRRQDVWAVARNARKAETNPQAKTTVHKVALDFLPTCGCGLIEDVGVTCRKHTPKALAGKA